MYKEFCGTCAEFHKEDVGVGWSQRGAGSRKLSGLLGERRAVARMLQGKDASGMI